MSEPVREASLPTIDLGRDPAPQLPAVDRALRDAGFLLVTGHGVDPGLRAAIRETARRFFHLPPALKEPYAVRVGEQFGHLLQAAEEVAGAGSGPARRPTGTRRGRRPRPT